MLIKRKSILTGEERTRDLPITLEQLCNWENGTVAQQAFPNLSPSDREFIMTGIADDEWETLKGEDE
jgi:hypothetical protein